MTILLLDPGHRRTHSSPALPLLRDTLESTGINLLDVKFTTGVETIPFTSPDLIVALGIDAARLLFGKGTTSEYKVPNGLGKRGQELFREPTLTELRRRDDLEYGVPGLSFPVLACTHPISALARASAKSAFIRDCQKAAERTGARAAVDQTRDYREIDDPCFALAHQIYAHEHLAIDTEFTPEGDLYCYSYSFQHGQAFVVFANKGGAKEYLSALIGQAKSILLHNAKADVPVICKWLGWENEDWPWDKTHDTMVLGYVLGVKPLSLKSMSESLLELKVIRLEEVMEIGQDFDTVDRADLRVYACQDADVTFRLFPLLMARLAA